MTRQPEYSLTTVQAESDAQKNEHNTRQERLSFPAGYFIFKDKKSCQKAMMKRGSTMAEHNEPITEELTENKKEKKDWRKVKIPLNKYQLLLIYCGLVLLYYVIRYVILKV